MNLPSAIIFINNNLNNIAQTTIINQLKIDEVMDKQEFDARLVSDPNYNFIIHSNHFRILVKLTNFQDYSNRDKANLVLFFKQGMVSVEGGNFGPPKLTFPIDRFNVYDLLRYNNSSEVNIIPKPAPLPCSCDCNSSCSNCCLEGIFALQAKDISGIHCANTDNEAHNTDFINRK